MSILRSQCASTAFIVIGIDEQQQAGFSTCIHASSLYDTYISIPSPAELNPEYLLGVDCLSIRFCALPSPSSHRGRRESAVRDPQERSQTQQDLCDNALVDDDVPRLCHFLEFVESGCNLSLGFWQ